MIGLEFSPALEEPISVYLARIRDTLEIEAEQEDARVRQWRERGDEDAEHRLISSQLHLVAKIAWRYRSYGQPFAKLVHEGNRALVDAVRRFDPDSGCRLATYAGWRIEAALVDYVLGSWSQVQARTAAHKMKCFFHLCRLKAHLAAMIQRNRFRKPVDFRSIGGDCHRGGSPKTEARSKTSGHLEPNLTLSVSRERGPISDPKRGLRKADAPE